jgi:hypothetical protein
MRDSVPLGRYFDLFKHLCAANVLVAALALVMLPWVTAGGGPFDALVLGAVFASFVLAARGAIRAMEAVTRPGRWDARALRRRLVLAASCLSFAVAIGVALPLVVTFSA